MESKVFKESPNRRCGIRANGPFERSSNDKCSYSITHISTTLFFLTGNQVCFFIFYIK